MFIAIHEREVYINHHKVDQSFEEFVSSIKNLVRESLNHIKRNKAHNMRQF
jgi:type III secretory pathway lipoprotein EscJ